jgi:hypothetical protein
MTSVELTDVVLGYVHSLELDVQHILDASLPNKQQHKAASLLVQDRFRTTRSYIVTQTNPFREKD